MAIILFCDNASQTLLPLTYTRPVADLRIGITTIAQKWATCFKKAYSFHTQPHLQAKFPLVIGADNLFINGSVCPDDGLLEAVDQLRPGGALVSNGLLIAVRLTETDAKAFDYTITAQYNCIAYAGTITRIKHPEDIFLNNAAEIARDFKRMTSGRRSAVLSSTNVFIGDDFFAEEGAVAECSTFNSKGGPIYLAKDTEVWEGSHIRGPFALCNHSQVKMGSKVYGGTTVGPYCRIGGEVNNAVLWGYSAKGHEGYLGNSVIGEWCNLGADTNNSNLKNNYAEVKLWDYTTGHYRKTGLQFCGLVMGDHSKCGINTMFNTGTVVGVNANIFGAGYPPNFIPDFSWGGAQGLETYSLKKAFETNHKVFERREHREFNQAEQQLLKKVYELTENYRDLII